MIISNITRNIFLISFVGFLILLVFRSFDKSQRVITPNFSFKAESCPKPGTDINKIWFNISLRPPDEDSFIFLNSINGCNQVKKVGGDFWWAKVIGPASFVVPLKDKDGVYYRFFRIPLDGTYSVILTLEFSIDEGKKDPPKDFFKKGTYQGQMQDLAYFGIAGYHPIFTKKFEFEVKSNKTIVNSVPQSWYDQPACIINNGYGVWVNNKYVTEKTITNNTVIKIFAAKNPEQIMVSNKSTVWFYGDSTQRSIYLYMKNYSPLCLKYSCQFTFTWTYTIIKNDITAEENTLFDGKDFNQTHFINDIKNVLISSPMRNNNSILVINFGIHQMKNFNMSVSEALLKEFIKMIQKMRKELLPNGFAKILWRSTTPVQVQDGRRRYLTTQRIIHWNNYCIAKLCECKIPILDVFWMAASYPKGSYDGVHYDDSVIQKAFDFLNEVLK